MQKKMKTKAILILVIALLGLGTPLFSLKVKAASMYTTNVSELKIYSYLTNQMNLNSAAACGIMANIYRECRFNEHLSSSRSYGICQWYDGTNAKNCKRFKAFCKSKGYDYKTLAAQLIYLKYDLQNRFPKLLKQLKKVSNTAKGAYDAGYAFCYNYERPTNYKTTASPSRGNLAKLTFWPIYKNRKVNVSYGLPSKHKHKYTTVTTPATVNANGKIEKICSTCKEVFKTTTIKKIGKVKLSATVMKYTGKKRKPKVSVKTSAGKKISSAYYKISYVGDCKSVGQYTVVISFRKRYAGSISLTYKICPGTPSISGISGTGQTLSLKWKKASGQLTGYQIVYSLDKKAEGTGAIWMKVPVTSLNTYIKDLSKGKRYYVKVRAYRTVTNGAKNVNIYSGWSKVRSVVIS